MLAKYLGGYALLVAVFVFKFGVRLSQAHLCLEFVNSKAPLLFLAFDPSQTSMCRPAVRVNSGAPPFLQLLVIQNS